LFESKLDFDRKSSQYFIEVNFIRNLSQLSQNQLYEFIRQRGNWRNWSTL